MANVLWEKDNVRVVKEKDGTIWSEYKGNGHIWFRMNLADIILTSFINELLEDNDDDDDMQSRLGLPEFDDVEY